MKEQTKVKLDNWIQKLLIAFIILQPILDIYMLLFDSKILVAGISLATIFRFSMIGVLTMLTIIKCPKKKSTIAIIAYGVIVMLYMVVHHLNALKVNDSLMNENIQYSFMSEFFYIARLTVPILLIYVIYELKLTYEQIKKMVVGSLITITSVIILSNLARVSYIAYSVDNTEEFIIRDNILCWFQGNPKNYFWEELTSRGFFHSGNQISAILIILLPIMLYIAIREKKARYWVLTFMQLLTMLMVGTRVSVIGGIGISVLIWMLYLIQMLLIEKKNIWQKTLASFSIVLLLIAGIYQISPFKMRTAYGIFNDIQLENKIPTKEEEQEKVAQTYEEKLAYVEEKYEENEEMLSHLNSVYSYKHDVEYWYTMVYNLSLEQLTMNRTIVNLLYPRVMELNNNQMDKWVGMSFDKTSSFLWPERDFKTHYYSIGLIGIAIFLVPYLIILAWSGINILINRKTKWKLDYVVFPLALAIAIVAGYASGNVFNEIFVTMYIALVAGICLNNTRKGKEINLDEEKGKVSKIGDYLKKLYKKPKEDFFAEVQESLEKNEKKFIVTANPETIMIAEETPEFEKALLDEKTIIIPDGIGVEKGAAIVGYKTNGTITGVELAKKLFEYGNAMKKSIFLFGAKNEVLTTLTGKLKKEYPDLVIVGAVDGYVENKDAIMEEIVAKKPDIVLVALGIPRQELLIHAYLDKLEKGILVGVGGSFDVLSGKKKRAPDFFVKYRLEWLYRITKEPKRLKRFVKSNMKYMIEIFKIRLSHFGKGVEE